MHKNKRILLRLALTLLISIAIATPTASSEIILYAFDQNPALYESCTEWVTLNNPSNASVEIGNWTLENADGESETIPEGTTLYPGAYYIYYPPYQWLDNENETHRVNVNQLLLKEGYAEAKDYPNEFNPDVWIESPLEYVDMTLTPEPTLTPTPSPSPSPTISSIPTFGFLFTILGIVAAIYLVR